MRIVYVLSQSSGGLPHYAAELANAVAEHEDVVVLKPSETTADDVFADRVRLIDAFEPLEMSIPGFLNLEFNVRKNLRGMASYRRLRGLAALDPDLVHDPTGVFPQVTLFAGLYDLTDVCPFVATYHEVPPAGPILSRSLTTEEFFSFVFDEVVGRVLPSVSFAGTIVHSENQKRTLVEKGTPSDEISVIPHGVYDFFTDYDYTEREEEPATVLFFGNLLRAKGIDTLIEAIPLVAEDVPEVTLVVAGDGRLSRRSRRIVAAHERHFEINDYFVPNEAVGEYFSRAAVVAVPYRSQAGGIKGHSGALSTAFSFGKPVVASTAGDFPRLVEAPGCGLTVPPDDPERLAAAIVRLLTNAAERRRMGERSSEQAERLSWANVAGQHLDLYERVLADGSVDDAG